MGHLSVKAGRAVLITVFGVLCFSCSNTPQHVRQPAVDALVDAVSRDNMTATISDLVAFGTRWPYEKQLEVADYLSGRLTAYNPTTTFHEYDFWGAPWRNVIVTIPGKTKPNETVIVCAHYDCDSEKKLSVAPGADDNASGTAAVVELARVLSGHSFARTIKLALFSREEQGLTGSTAFIKSIDRTKEKVVLAINLDMIANGSDSEDIDLFTRPEYTWLADDIRGLADAYGLNAKKNIRGGCD